MASRAHAHTTGHPGHPWVPLALCTAAVASMVALAVLASPGMHRAGIGPLRAVYMGSPPSRPQTPFASGETSLRACDETTSFGRGVLVRLPRVPQAIGSVVCFASAAGPLTSTPAGSGANAQFVGVFYVPNGMSALRDSGSALLAAGAVEIDLDVNTTHMGTLAPSDGPYGDRNLAAINIHGAPGFIQRVRDVLYSSWVEKLPSGAMCRSNLLARHAYSPDTVVALARALIPGPPGPELGQPRFAT